MHPRPDIGHRFASINSQTGVPIIGVRVPQFTDATGVLVFVCLCACVSQPADANRCPSLWRACVSQSLLRQFGVPVFGACVRVCHSRARGFFFFYFCSRAHGAVLSSSAGRCPVAERAALFSVCASNLFGVRAASEFRGAGWRVADVWFPAPMSARTTWLRRNVAPLPLRFESGVPSGPQLRCVFAFPDRSSAALPSALAP